MRYLKGIPETDTTGEERERNGEKGGGEARERERKKKPGLVSLDN